VGKRRTKHPLEDNPFLQGLLEWMDSPEGEQSIDALDTIYAALAGVDVNAKGRQILWPDGQRLSIAESVERLHGAHPELSLELIESKLISWLEMEFAPPSYSPTQLDELDRLTEQWIADHERSKAKLAKKRPRTRHS
jgi:hypothetical protein